MNHTQPRPLICLLLVGLMFFHQGAGLAAAQDRTEAGDVYRVSPGDVLRLNVPQQQLLDRELTVSEAGTIYLPQVGEVTLHGLTLPEAREFLTQRLRLYNPAITEVVLTVLEYSSLRIYVIGAVRTPGSYTFESPPTLWEVLRAAGGPGEGASLASCRIITIADGRPTSRTVNLSGYLTGETFPADLLQGGDTLVVPTVADGVVGVPSTSGVQVFGGVRTPTTVPIDQPTEMLTVLMLAGAPIESAELHKINWVHRRAGGPDQDVATKVNMRQFLRQGRAEGNPIVYPGDVLYLPTYRQSWFARNLPIFLTTLTSVSTILLAYDRFSSD